MKTALHQRFGAYGMTAVLALLGGGAVMRRCAPAPTPAPVPAAVPTSPVGSNVLDEVLSLTNQNRANAGLAPLAMNTALSAAAQAHSLYQANIGTITHTGSASTNPGQRIASAGYSASTWGENVASGYPTASAVIDGWMNSQGHRDNILNANFTEIGLAAVTGANGIIYWTMDLARA